MSPIGGRHAACVREINRLLGRQFGDDLRVDVQSPVRPDEHGAPQPDLAVIRARTYGDSLPVLDDVLLLIEVADTSPASDRELKLPLYARAGIAEIWLVDLNADVIERHTEPSESGYRLIRRAGERRSSPWRCPRSLSLSTPRSVDLYTFSRSGFARLVLSFL